MSTPSVSTYSKNILINYSGNSSDYILITIATNVLYYVRMDDPNLTLYALVGETSTPLSITNLITFISTADIKNSLIGVTPDNSHVIINSINNLFYIQSSSPYSVSQFTRTAGDYTYCDEFSNAVFLDNTHYFYSRNADTSPRFVTIDVGGSGWSCSRWASSTPLPTSTTIQSSNLAICNGNLYAFCQNGANSYIYGWSTLAETTPFLALTLTSNYISAGMYGVTNFVANSTPYNLMFMYLYYPDASTHISEYQVDGSNNFTLIDTISEYSQGVRYGELCGSFSSSGDQPGNLRLFVSTTFGAVSPYSQILVKLYNPTVGNGPLGSSIGGDPHIKTLKGENLLILETDRVKYLYYRNDHFNLKIDVDFFSLKNDYDSFGKTFLNDHQHSLAITNKDDSYLKYIYIFLNGEEYTFNTLTLLLVGVEDNGDETEYPSISIGKIERYLPGSCPSTRTKFIREKCIAKRYFKIFCGEFDLSFELCLENEIHVNDLSLEIIGKCDIDSLGGLCVDGILIRNRDFH